MATRGEREAREALNQRHREVLNAMLAEPANGVCADCRSKDPRWASWNLGVFMCIECSGVHRSVGTHISKVKSVNLDTWTTEQVENMLRWGNERANWYWEANMPPGVWQKMNRQALVRAKYERKEWAAKTPITSTPPTRGSTALAILSASEPDDPEPATAEKKKKKKKKQADDADAAGTDGGAVGEAESMFAGMTTADDRAPPPPAAAASATAAAAAGARSTASAIPRLASTDNDTPVPARPVAAAAAAAAGRPAAGRPSEARPGTPAAVPAPVARTATPTAPAARTATPTAPAVPAPGRDLQALEDLFHGMNVYPAADSQPAPSAPATASVDDLLGLDLQGSHSSSALAQPAVAAPKPQISASAILSLYNTPANTASTSGVRGIP